MAANISNVQLTVLQLPQVAHDQVPVQQQAAIAASQAPAIIDRQDQEASETVQLTQQVEGSKVGDALSGNPNSPEGSPERRQRRRSELREAQGQRLPHPRGVGSLVDIEI